MSNRNTVVVRHCCKAENSFQLFVRNIDRNWANLITVIPCPENEIVMLFDESLLRK